MLTPNEKLQYASNAGRGHNSSAEKLMRELSQPTSPAALASFAVADLPAAADYTDCLVICSNGAAGSPILAFSNGTNWLRSDTGGNVAAS